MKNTLLLTAMILTTNTGLASAASEKYTQEEIDQMPRFSSIEQVRCPSAKFHSVKKRLECKEKVRIELYEKQKSIENGGKS